MSDQHGGFYILRDDAELGGIVLNIVADYLGDTDQSGDQRLLWFGRQGMDALLVSLASGDEPDQASSRWTAQNLGLGGRIARAAGARVWAYTYDNALGSESIAYFGIDGTIVRERTTNWDEGALRALDELTGELDVPRALVEYDLPYATKPYVQALNEPFDAGAFGAWLGARSKVLWPEHNHLVALFMRENAVAELEHCAKVLGVRAGDVIVALWEACKPDVFGSIPLVERDHLQGPEAYLKPPPSRDTTLVLAHGDEAPPLDQESPKTAIRLYLAPDTIREMQELALAGDRSQSYVLQKTYACGRARLLATVGDGS